MNIETTKAELIGIIETMQTQEMLDRIKSQAVRLKDVETSSLESNYTIEEVELIDKIQTAVPKGVFEKYHDLFVKHRDNQIDEKERKELKKIAYLLEKYNVERLTHALQLSILWQTDLNDVMQRLNIHPSEDL